MTQAIIGAAYQVANVLGTGFLEKVYENALALELKARGFDVEQQRPIQVRYREEVVGIYQADLMIAGAVIIELKAVEHLDRSHRAQCLNYLRATGLTTGLVINFGSAKVEVRRVVCSSHSNIVRK
jgi:GxxExxY protein